MTSFDVETDLKPIIIIASVRVLARRFLADIMDNANLIRNVCLAGHLHHGKVMHSLSLWISRLSLAI